MIGHRLSWFCFYSTMATAVTDSQWFGVRMANVEQYTRTHRCTVRAAVYFSGPAVTANILAQLGSNPRKPDANTTADLPHNLQIEKHNPETCRFPFCCCS